MWYPGRQVCSLRFGSRPPVPGSPRSGERGAALVTVLLFMMLIFILITSMLSVTGNEIVIAGLQRDGVRATELAQAGIQEAIRRVEEGRTYLIAGGWTSSLDPRVRVTVTRQYTGTNSAYLDLTATASNIGRSTRRLSALVLQQAIAFPPEITFAYSVDATGSADISCGDAYASLFIQYKNFPSNSCSKPPTITYAGWAVSKLPGPVVNPCYTHAGCVAANPGNPDVAKWYPGTRRSVNEYSTLGLDIQAFQINAEANGCVPTNPAYTNLWSGTNQQNQVVVNWPEYGFDRDDRDGAGPQPSQVASIFPCGFAYKWVREDFVDVDGAPRSIYFKFIIFEQWLQNFWIFNEPQLTFDKRDSVAGANGAACVDTSCLAPPTSQQPDLVYYEEFGAVPPFPSMSTMTNNYDCKVTGGGVLNALPVACTLPDGTPSTTDLGCKNPEMACSPTTPKVILLEGDWTINGTIGGHGTLVVDGTLIVNGTFDYWGTIAVDGTVQAGTGDVNVHGGLVALGTLELIGNITVEGGGTVGGATPPTGRSNVLGKAWWER